MEGIAWNGINCCQCYGSLILWPFSPSPQVLVLQLGLNDLSVGYPVCIECLGPFLMSAVWFWWLDCCGWQCFCGLYGRQWDVVLPRKKSVTILIKKLSTFLRAGWKCRGNSIVYGLLHLFEIMISTSWRRVCDIYLKSLAVFKAFVGMKQSS